MQRLTSLGRTLMLALFVLAIASCSKDDAEPDIRITNGSSSFDVLNDCDIGSGPLATLFTFTLNLAALPAEDIDGIEFDLEWEDGSESQNLFDDNFDIIGNSLEFDWCFRFGSLNWFEIRAKVLADDERQESNEVTIRVNRPSGAN